MARTLEQIRESNRISAAKYRAEHAEENREYQAKYHREKWYPENKEKQTKATKDWRARNKKRYKNCIREYQRKHKAYYHKMSKKHHEKYGDYYLWRSRMAKRKKSINLLSNQIAEMTPEYLAAWEKFAELQHVIAMKATRLAKYVTEATREKKPPEGVAIPPKALPIEENDDESSN